MADRLEEILLLELARLLEPLVALAHPGLEISVPDPSGTFAAQEEGFHAALQAFLQGAGLDVPDLLATDGPVVQLATALQGVAAVIEPLLDGDLSGLASVVDEVEKTVAAVKGFAGATPDLPPPGEVAERIAEHLVARYLAQYHPGVQAAAGLLGILDEAALRDEMPGQFDFEAIGAALGDPVTALAAESGFGTETLRGDLVLARLAQLLEAFDLDVDVVEARSIGLPEEATPDVPSDEVLVYDLFGHDDPSLSVTLSLRAIPGTAGHPPGFRIFVSGTGKGKVSFALPEDPDTTAVFTASAEAGELVGGVLRPGGVSFDVSPPDLESSAEIRREMVLADLTLGPLSILAENGSARVGLKLTGGQPEVYAEAQVEKLNLALRAVEADGFLAAVLPPEGLSAALAPRLGWSSKAGFYMEPGGTGLTARLPTQMAFGKAFNLQAMVVGLEFQDAPGGLAAVLTTGAEARLDIGPVAATVEGLGIAIDLDIKPGGDGPAPRRPRFVPPTGLGVSVDAGPVKGGGYLSFDHTAGRYAGALALEIPPVAITAFGVLDTRMPDGRDGWSLLMFVSGRFPAIPLGFGFNLLGVGGILGLNRDVDVDALFAAVRAGKAGQLLAPDDPVADAPALLRDAQAIFPVTRGQHVFGPTVALGWGVPQQLFTLDLALALTLPEPLRLILIGTLRAQLPDEKLPVVTLNVDVAGVLDFTASRFDLEGRIYDSRIQGVPLAGGFAVRSAWGAAPELAFSVGGLHPAFEPPPGFPAIERLNIDLSKGSSFKLRIEGYFAVTSNSLQFGAALDLQARAAGFTILAELGFDVLMLLDPFQMDAAIRASAAIRRGSRTLCAVRLSGRLRGPGPWRATGKATIEILFFDVDVGFDTSFGETARAALAPRSAWDVLRPRLADAASWGSSAQAQAGDVVLGDAQGLLLPDAPLELRQDAVPLGLRLDHFGGYPVAGLAQFDLVDLRDQAGRQMTREGPVTARFAPGNFLTMSDAEKLAAPAFEEMEAGARYSAGVVAGRGTAVTQPRDLILIDAPDPAPGFVPLREVRRLQAAAPDTAGLGPAAPAAPATGIRILPEDWTVPDADLNDPGMARGAYAQQRGGARAPVRVAEVGR